MNRRVACLLGVLGVVGACSSEAPKRPPVAGGGAPSLPVPGITTDGGPEAGRDAGDAGVDDDGGGVCSEIVLTGLLVDRIGVVGDPPVSLGGTIVDGLYDLTSYEVFVGAAGVGGPTGLTARSTIRITAGKIEQILQTAGSTPTATAVSKSTYSASGTTFTASELCPDLGAGTQLQYTATDPQLILRDPITKEALTFVKKP